MLIAFCVFALFYSTKMFWCYVQLFLLSFGLFGAVQLPPEIQRCSRSDPDFSKCMAKSMTHALTIFKGGNKDFGLPVLEPFQIEKIEIQAEPGNSVNLNQKYENVKLHNMINSEITKYKEIDDGTTCQWEMEVVTPFSRMEADYTLKGQILVFPINSHGKCNVTLYNIVNTHKAECESYMKKGKKFRKVTNYSMNMTVEKCTFEFENIFPGNEQISNEIIRTINENSLDIFKEVKSGFEAVLSRLHINGCNSVFSRLPLKDLYLP